MATKEQKQQLSEERAELTRQRAMDTIDRYKFLLGQSELFSHFIRAKGKSCMMRARTFRTIPIGKNRAFVVSLTYKHDRQTTTHCALDV
jgi:hypothetical protein